MAKFEAAPSLGDPVYRTPLVLDGVTEIPVFMEWPNLEEFPDRLFPAIVITGQFAPDRRRLESVVLDRYENLDVVNFTKDVLPDPEPYTATYQITLLARNVRTLRSMEDQVADVILIHDTITANGEPWVCWRTQDTIGPVYDKDQKVYASTFTIEVEFVHLPAIARGTIPYVDSVTVQ